eukprot:scaffold372950_cov27-Prasinocladus_malaysianus.AAC.2
MTPGVAGSSPGLTSSGGGLGHVAGRWCLAARDASCLCRPAAEEVRSGHSQFSRGQKCDLFTRGQGEDLRPGSDACFPERCQFIEDLIGGRVGWSSRATLSAVSTTGARSGLRWAVISLPCQMRPGTPVTAGR